MTERRRVVHPMGGKVLTQQAHKDEANINSIIARWRRGAVVPVNHRNPQYGDFSGVKDFHAELDRVNAAEVEFLRLPSKVRRACQNDVGTFLLKCTTEEGLTEMIGEGLEAELAPPGVEMPVEKEVTKIRRENESPEVLAVPLVDGEPE